jgi:hypothetical protein
MSEKLINRLPGVLPLAELAALVAVDNVLLDAVGDMLCRLRFFLMIMEACPRLYPRCKRAWYSGSSSTGVSSSDGDDGTPVVAATAAAADGVSDDGTVGVVVVVVVVEANTGATGAPAVGLPGVLVAAISVLLRNMPMYAFDACNKLAPETRPAVVAAASGAEGAPAAAGKEEEAEEVEGREDERPAEDLEVI